MFSLRSVVSLLIATTIVSAPPISAATVNRMTVNAHSSATSSTWPEFVIHSFSFVNGGGVIPLGGLFRDTSGKLYGTTSGAGSRGGGTVFELTPPAPGKTGWSEKTIHEFVVSSKEGYAPAATVITGPDGALYGTTEYIGAGCYSGYCGTVFKLAPPAPGRTDWTQTVLHNFVAAKGDGAFPVAALVMDEHGALYGTTTSGGVLKTGCNGVCGTVFKITPPARGKTAWTETVLHSFTSADGATPEGNLILAGGALYGTTLGGGPRGYGTVFKLSPPEAGKSIWTETVLHAFGSGPRDGANPAAGLVETGGALYGTTSYGGPQYCLGGCGSVFKLTPPKTGKSYWAFDTLHFFGTAADGIGYRPSAAPIVDRSGALYSTTYTGGAKGFGTVFKPRRPQPVRAVGSQACYITLPFRTVTVLTPREASSAIRPATYMAPRNTAVSSGSATASSSNCTNSSRSRVDRSLQGQHRFVLAIFRRYFAWRRCEA